MSGGMQRLFKLVRILRLLDLQAGYNNHVNVPAARTVASRPFAVIRRYNVWLNTSSQIGPRVTPSDYSIAFTAVSYVCDYAREQFALLSCDLRPANKPTNAIAEHVSKLYNSIILRTGEMHSASPPQVHGSVGASNSLLYRLVFCSSAKIAVEGVIRYYTELRGSSDKLLSTPLIERDDAQPHRDRIGIDCGNRKNSPINTRGHYSLDERDLFIGFIVMSMKDVVIRHASSIASAIKHDVEVRSIGN